jgi:transcriptional regulator with XRE-family HTH domain
MSVPRNPRATSLCSPDATGIHSIGATVGLALLRHRDRHRLTQADMARRCGISRGRYNQLESGRQTGITVVTLMRLAAACGTTPDVILGFRFDVPERVAGIFVGLR